MMEKDRRSRLWNLSRLRELRRHHADEVTIFCGHDPFEFESLAGRPLDAPAPRPIPPPAPEPTLVA